jgi:hypothetical protein
MARMIDQVRASKLPSSMMQFAARGALQVSPAENIEILVHLALHNKVFGDLARMTLAGWDEKASLAAAEDPQTSQEVLGYFISPDNLRPHLLPALLENLSVPESALVKLAMSALRDTVEIMFKSKRVRSSDSIRETLQANPYLKKEEAAEMDGRGGLEEPTPTAAIEETAAAELAPVQPESSPPQTPARAQEGEITSPEHDEEVSAYLKEHGEEISAEGEKPFQAIGGIVELLAGEHSPETETSEAPETAKPPDPAPPAGAAVGARPIAAAHKKPRSMREVERKNTLQKINSLDVKGRIQLALKGNKEERSILIRDGTKVVALAVLDAPKLSDGEVEKFASQKNVLEAVLRQIPLKRRFMKNYIVVRNLVANPRTPLDLGLSLMKNLLAQDLKNLSANKEVSETIRKLAFKMYKQKTEQANKKQ